MRLLDLSLPTAAENLALDEALLEEADRAAEPRELLRLWEFAAPTVVLGCSSRAADEADLTACRRRSVAVVRRTSGGATIVAGPGCLMYSVVLSYARRPELRAIDQAHTFVLRRTAEALRPLVPGVEPAGTSDLAVGGRKFSGNSLRCKRHALLYHGTLLYDFPLPLVAELLRMPPRQPAYRAGRPHTKFVMNLGIAAAQLRAALIAGWQAESKDATWPQAETERLATEKHGAESWVLRL
jgi:lipoate-protein ligase A